VTTPAPPVHSGAHGVRPCVCGVLPVTDPFTRKNLQLCVSDIRTTIYFDVYRARICKRLWNPGIDSARLHMVGFGFGFGRIGVKIRTVCPDLDKHQTKKLKTDRSGS
jgi:hypothetical protein